MTTFIHAFNRAYFDSDFGSNIEKEDFSYATKISECIDNHPHLSRLFFIIPILSLPIIGCQRGWNAQITIRRYIENEKCLDRIKELNSELHNRFLLVTTGLIWAIFKMVIGTVVILFNPKSFARSINPSYIRLIARMETNLQNQDREAVSSYRRKFTKLVNTYSLQELDPIYPPMKILRLLAEICTLRVRSFC